MSPDGTPLRLDRLPEALAAHPDARLRFVGGNGEAATRTFAQLHADVLETTAQLRALGIAPRDLVGILGPNSYDWIVADLALLMLGALSVAFPAQHLGAQNGAPASELMERYALSGLLISRTVATDVELPPGAGFLEERPLHFERRAGHDRPAIAGDTFTVAFSSGTAGIQKGLMLSRSGVEHTIQTSARAWDLTPDDDLLVVLPFSSFQQRYLVYLAIFMGCGVLVVGPERMFPAMKRFEPTVILGPPSFFQIVESRVRNDRFRARCPYLLARVLHAAFPNRTRRIRARLGRRWTGVFGGRVRLMLTGSAPVPAQLVAVLQRLGAPLYEVYGSTEVGWIALNGPDRHRIGTAGMPADGVTVDLEDDGEIVVRSPSPQALGYVFDGVETQPAVFLPDGRIATGDQGRFDRSGYLQLIGRKKNVIVTRSGVKINPEELEREIEELCPVQRAVVVGTGRGTSLACVVWLDDAEDEHRRGEIEAGIEKVNGRHERSHQIANVFFRPGTELTPSSGLLTRNLKVDRAAVLELLAERIG